MWYKLLKDRFGAQKPESLSANIFCYTLGSPQTAQEPLNNIVRISYQTMAAVLGGVQTLATSSYDEALGLPSDEAVRVALRTQQILAYETGVARTADPLGGSYFVESLTDEFEAAAWEYLGTDRGAGRRAAARWSPAGCTPSSRAGLPPPASPSRTGERVVVGVNRFAGRRARSATSRARRRHQPDRARADRAAGRGQAGPEAPTVSATLWSSSTRRPTPGENTIPALLEAVRAYATVGEICDVLAKPVGEIR